MRAAYDLTTRAHLDTFMVAILFEILQFRVEILQFRVVLLLVVNTCTLTTSTRATTHERTREGSAETAEHRHDQRSAGREIGLGTLP